MESRFGGKINVYGPVMPDMKAMGKRTLDWDLNDWNWDSDLFLANSLNPPNSECRSRQLLSFGPETTPGANVPNDFTFCSNEINYTTEEENREQEKRRRFEVIPEEDLNSETDPLKLKLGGQLYTPTDNDADKLEGKNGKKSKVVGYTTNQPVCQVKDCRVELSNAKEYHRRHKVCEMHSKASQALVGQTMQRFCQQCSRFHALEEFDEGKRSCRRRLAGHNKRRRKTHSETSSVHPGSVTDEKGASKLLVNLLRILCNSHSNGSDQLKDQDMLSNLLQNLTGQVNGNQISNLMQRSQHSLNAGPSTQVPEQDPLRADRGSLAVTLPDAQKGLPATENQGALFLASNPMPITQTAREVNGQRNMPIDIDLNNSYDDSQDCYDVREQVHSSLYSFWEGHDLVKPSQPQTCGNSDSSSGRSSSSCSESCTDRIVFKLFGKDPNDLPHSMRTEILDWLSHSPTDIEGYIRPGCIVLTVYLRLTKSLWEEFCCDLSSCLGRLLDVSDDPFWKKGWIYTRLRQHAALIYDGRVVLDTQLPRNCGSKIFSISPLAVPASATVPLVVRGTNLTQPSSRILCAIEGSYVVQENCYELEGANTATEQDEVQYLSFCCSVPDVIGRGFIEVEEHGFSGCFFPFIIAEPEICSEICTLEKVLEAVNTEHAFNRGCKIEARNHALEFIHEMGWLLHRSHLSFRPGYTDPGLDLFPLGRLKWLVEFTMSHGWCAVLTKLLDLMFSGIVDAGENPNIKHALLGMDLLHDAVRKTSRPMVELLLTYVPNKVYSTSKKEGEQPVYGAPDMFLFRPDLAGAGGLTPLHIAACTEGSEIVLDALLEDPGLVGIEAWKNARDSTGLTPSDYASLRGHYTYHHLVRRKINKKLLDGHVVVDIPSPSDLKSNQNQTVNVNSSKVDTLYTEKSEFEFGSSCKLCELKSDYGCRKIAFTCRPLVLSLVTIAAVCVCAALLFKSLPQVGCLFGPFKWELLQYGAM